MLLQKREYLNPLFVYYNTTTTIGRELSFHDLDEAFGAPKSSAKHTYLMSELEITWSSSPVN
jgi:hypothetical protein